MAAAAGPPDDGLLLHLAETVGGAIFGAVITLVTFRTRLSKMDARMSTLEGTVTTSVRDIRDEMRDERRTSERRQLFILEVLSDIANKVGANERMKDLTIRLLHDERDDP